MHSCGSFISPATGSSVQFIARDAVAQTGVPINYTANQFPVPDRGDTGITAHSPAGLLPTTPNTLSGSTQVDDYVMQISGTGHWFLEGWIGDHSVEFLVDSGSSVTAISNSFYQTLMRAGAPLGVLEHTARTLRSANGTGIGVSGCSHCVVSFMGLQMEFPIIICDLATGIDAIIGTDVLGYHTTWTLKTAPCSRCFTSANRDIHIARQNLAELQLYIDDHAAHVANCAGANDDEVPLMSAETFPRLEGGIRAALEEVNRR